jgi:hypothetical protein
LLKKIETDMFARKTTVGRLLGTVKRLQFLAHRSYVRRQCNLKSRAREILSRHCVCVHPKTQQDGKGARRERPNWGLAQLMRPAKAAPAVPFANFAAMLMPERLH